ncbi:unnamed protein product [Triticum turgidum subsp. durum]|uniref:Non-specific serine/threonine protein kinase n=1 Tax=Triticum turgidum subsp. durum TaxID=4567 RepID=A0A9R0YES0_TRITD|nr:unnamed protein product [Triticum turgidum subsp. durum]
MPKITDFGLSRCFEEGQTRVITENVGGTIGYLAPEFHTGEITHKFDLYSLGVIVMEMLTGKKGYQSIEDVRESWSYRSDILWWEQIRVCAEIGIECTDLNPAKRPESMKHIIDRLLAAESSTQVIPTGGPTSKLIVLHPSALRFPFEINKVITCPLELTNNTDKHVAFRLKDKSGESSFLRLPLYGIVPPNTPYTLIVTTQEIEELPRKWIIDVILDGATLILGDGEHQKTFHSQPDKYCQEMRNALQEVELKALYTLPRHITTLSSKPIPPTIKIICKVKGLDLYSLDINQAKQWIIIGEDSGHVRIWDYKTQRKVDSLKVSASYVSSIKFIARKQWILAGTHSGKVHVYDYETMHKITTFRVAVGGHAEVVSLAVHPTQPYLLSAGTHLKLWDWDKGWECVQTFECQFLEKVCHVAFNRNDTFASATSGLARGFAVKVWSLDSPKSNYTLFGHSDKVNCLDFFTCHDQEFLVTGSDDETAKIWYLHKKICAYTLEAFASPVTSVLYQPDIQTLITGSKDGAIYLWCTTNCRIYSRPPTLTRIINIGCVVYHLACAMGRVVIGKKKK